MSYKNIKEFTVEENLMNAKLVENVLQQLVILGLTKEVIQEKNVLIANFVKNITIHSMVLGSIREHTRAKNHLIAIFVVCASRTLQRLSNTGRNFIITLNNYR